MVTIRTVEEFLREDDWKYEVDGSVIRTGAKGSHTNFRIFIDLELDNYLRFLVVPEGTSSFRSVSPELKLKLYEIINSSHSAKVFSRIHFDADGDLVADWFLPLSNGNPVNKTSFFRCMLGITFALDEIFPTLMKVRWEN